MLQLCYSKLNKFQYAAEGTGYGKSVTILVKTWNSIAFTTKEIKVIRHI